MQFLSDQFIEKICSKLKALKDSGQLGVLTFALSPECCPSWEDAIGLLTKMMSYLDMEFQI